MNQISYSHGPQDKPLLVRHQNLRYSWGELAEVVEDCACGQLTLGLRSERAAACA